MNRLNLSVVIITKNEEKNILDCLEGLQRASEIIIVDDFSVDRTLEVVKTSGFKNVKVFKRSLNGDFSKQRNFGLLKAKAEWVLFVDADERVSADLLSEIESKISKQDFQGYYILRKDVMWGRKLIHGETGNIKFLRLGLKSAGKWRGDVHETWQIKEQTAVLEKELIHYPHQTVTEFLAEINSYSTMRANELKKEKVRVSALDIVLYPKSKFVLNYVLKLGFLDGLPGLIFALMMSFHSFLVRSKLYLQYNDAK